MMFSLFWLYLASDPIYDVLATVKNTLISTSMILDFSFHDLRLVEIFNLPEDMSQLSTFE